MLADSFFWYGLALKAAMTATIVVVASVAAERSGPFLAALIAALPTAASAAYIILALEHPPAFIAAGAVGSMAANAAVAIFALTYAALAQRRGVVLSLGAATLVWFAAAALLRSVEWTPASALALNAVVFAVTIPLSARYRAASVPSQAIKRTAYDLPLRAAAVAVVVAVVTTASHWIGSFASGVFAVPDRDGEFGRGHPSAGRGQGGGRRVRACAAGARRPVPGISRRALSCRADWRVGVLRRRARHHHRVEQRALAHAPRALAPLKRYLSIESFCARITSAHLRFCALM